MQLWPVPLPTHEAPHGAAAGLIDCIARPDFGRRTLARLNCALPLAWWTVYQVFDDQAPRLCAHGSFDAPDIALDCWRIYRRGVYLADTHFHAARAEVRAGAPANAVVTHCVADDFDRAHREQIYQAHSLSERLSLVSTDDDGHEGALLAVNLFRHRAQPRFSAAEIDTVFALASPLLAVVRRHVELSAQAASGRETGDALVGDDIAPLPTRLAAQRLHHHCPELTERELAVCERLLRGWTFDGIAADLGVSPSTAKTYRNRAFGRLGIHHRNALFALVLE
ncbi:MAG: LuxR C-terminal-related transcriptional regulator [Burkholderiales bacterium]